MIQNQILFPTVLDVEIYYFVKSYANIRALTEIGWGHYPQQEDTLLGRRNWELCFSEISQLLFAWESSLFSSKEINFPLLKAL